MARRRLSRRKHLKAKTVLLLPGLDQARSAVLRSLSSADAQRGYGHVIDEFIVVLPGGPSAGLLYCAIECISSHAILPRERSTFD